LPPDESNRKAFGFMLWFLKMYLPADRLGEVSSMITDATDDSSCDLIFFSETSDGNDKCYVVQSKWFMVSNIGNTNHMLKEVRACLVDFDSLKSGSRPQSVKNANFNTQYERLKAHVAANGKIKFIFLALCKGAEVPSDYLVNFTSPLVE